MLKQKAYDNLGDELEVTGILQANEEPFLSLRMRNRGELNAYSMSLSVKQARTLKLQLADFLRDVKWGPTNNQKANK